MNYAWFRLPLFFCGAMDRRFWMRRRGRFRMRFYFLFRNLRLGWGRLMRSNWLAGCRFFRRGFRLCCHFKKLLMAQAL
jgi:hypothetical protein